MQRVWTVVMLFVMAMNSIFPGGLRPISPELMQSTVVQDQHAETASSLQLDPTPTATDLPTETPTATESEPPVVTDPAPSSEPPVPTATSTPMTTDEPIPSPEAPLLTNTPTPTTSDEPTLSPTEMRTPTETPTATDPPPLLPTNTASPSETPTLLPSPTISPTITPTITPSPEFGITLKAEPALASPGEKVSLNWEITPSGALISLSESVLRVTVPAGFTPLKTDIPFDAAARTLLVPMPVSKGSLEWDIARETSGEPVFVVELLDKNVVLASTKLTIYLEGNTKIAPTGGEAKGLNGKVKVKIPDQAISEAISLNIHPLFDLASIPYPLSGRPFEILAQTDREQKPVHQFDKPIEIEVDYSDLGFSGDPSTLSVFYYDEAEGTWEPLPTQMDAQRQVLIATSDHLTVFDIGNESWESARIPSVANFQVSTFTGAATYSYPIQVPQGPGGLQPSLTLSYNSQVVDSASSRTQASWMGMGWSLETGYIQRNMNGTPTYFGEPVDNWLNDDTLGDGDDTFTLIIGGQSWPLVRMPDTDGDPNTIEYRTAQESFWRIRRYHSHGTPGGYPGDTSYWIVWDKVGMQYYFEDQAHYPVYHPSGCIAPFMQVWAWGLSRVRNIYNQELHYTYTIETSTKKSPACGGFNAYAITALYPDQIQYPDVSGNPSSPVYRYRIRFIREGRTDFDTAWDNYYSFVLFQRSLLSDILIEQDSGQNGQFQTLVGKYHFTYATNAIFPGITWSAGGKTPSLSSITEYGTGGTNSLPPTTFTYGDHMHLTEANNNYGGKVTFTYEADPWYELDSSDLSLLRTWDGQTFTGTLDVGSLSIMHPGRYYRLSAGVHGEGFEGWFSYSDGSQNYSGPHENLSSHSETNPVTYIIKLSPDANQMHLYYNTVGCNPPNCPAITSYKAIPLLTRYRVIAKTLHDDETGDSNTITYRYDGAATNDSVHSATVKNLAADRLYTPAWSEYRGNSTVQEVRRMGK